MSTDGTTAAHAFSSFSGEGLLIACDEISASHNKKIVLTSLTRSPQPLKVLSCWMMLSACLRLSRISFAASPSAPAGFSPDARDEPQRVRTAAQRTKVEG